MSGTAKLGYALYLRRQPCAGLYDPNYGENPMLYRMQRKARAVPIRAVYANAH
jgi:hypothetical protein